MTGRSVCQHQSASLPPTIEGRHQALPAEGGAGKTRISSPSHRISRFWLFGLEKPRVQCRGLTSKTNISKPSPAPEIPEGPSRSVSSQQFFFSSTRFNDRIQLHSSHRSPLAGSYYTCDPTTKTGKLSHKRVDPVTGRPIGCPTTSSTMVGTLRSRWRPLRVLRATSSPSGTLL